MLSFLSCLAEAQKMDMPLAEKLLDKELAFFVARTDSERAVLLMDKAGLYNSKAEYQKALAELERADKFSSAGNSKLKYEKMLNYFLSDQFSSCAAIRLSQEDVKILGKEKEYVMMRFFSLNAAGLWAACKEELLDYCSTCDSVEIKKIASLAVSYNYISPSKCRRLSDIVPGLGMVKAGKPFKGATSFLLQAGIVAGTAYCFSAGYIVTGIVSGVFPLMKFHQGGNRLSAILAEEHNEKERLKLKAQYSEEIEKVVHL